MPLKDWVDGRKAKAEPAKAEGLQAGGEGAWWKHPDAFPPLGWGVLRISHCDYLGGLSNRPKAYKNKILMVGARGLDYHQDLVIGIKSICLIPWDQVAAIEVERPEEASKRVSAGQVLASDIFAPPANQSASSPVITVRLKSGEEAFFQTRAWTLGDLKAKLAPALSHLHPPAAQSARPVSGADEIRKLAELRDEGILTDAEFKSKKAELLARM
jgi:hypothetical protein